MPFSLCGFYDNGSDASIHGQNVNTEGHWNTGIGIIETNIVLQPYCGSRTSRCVSYSCSLLIGVIRIDYASGVNRTVCVSCLLALLTTMCAVGDGRCCVVGVSLSVPSCQAWAWSTSRVHWCAGREDVTVCF